MARNRMIRPEFWEDDKIGECSPTARLLFVALWNFADDEGYLEYRPKWIKAKCFPYDELKIGPLIDELLKSGSLVKQGDILWVKNFLKHQKIEKPKPSLLSQKFKDSPTIPRTLPDSSPPKIEEKLREIEVEISSNEDEASPHLQKKINSCNLESTELGVSGNFGREDINKMLVALKSKIGIQNFVDSAIERNMAKHCVNLIGKIGKDTFVMRLDALLADPFHYKNCNKIKYVYNNIKGFIEPKSKVLDLNNISK